MNLADDRMRRACRHGEEALKNKGVYATMGMDKKAHPKSAREGGSCNENLLG